MSKYAYNNYVNVNDVSYVLTKYVNYLMMSFLYKKKKMTKE